MSIKQAIIDKNEGAEIEFAEYTNLILDDMNVDKISAEDKEFLEQFKECQFLGLNSCGLTSLENLPNIAALQRLELCDNRIQSLTNVQWPPNLKTLKLANNQLSNFEDLLTSLKSIKDLTVVDLSSNTLKETVDYEKKLREALTTLLVVDGKDTEGNEVESEDEYDEDDEEGEGDESELNELDEEGEDEDEGEDNDADQTTDKDVDTEAAPGKKKKMSAAVEEGGAQK